MKNLINEFKEFIKRGNVIDLAVAVVIGGAFSSIVNSLVNDLIMPVIGVIIGGINFTGLTLSVGSAVIRYGAFLQSVINFLIIAFAIFMLVKLINKFFKQKEEVKEVVKAEEIVLLEEIRDLLKKQK